MIFQDPMLEAAVDDWDSLIRRNDLNNGQMLALLAMLLLGNLSMQEDPAAPEDLVDSFALAAMTLDPRAFVRLCGVKLARDLPSHWKFINSRSGVTHDGREH